MLHSFECQHCQQVVYPYRRVCPQCQACCFSPIPDQKGTVLGVVHNSNHQSPAHFINLVRTQRGVLVITRSTTELKNGQTVLITDNNNELTSTLIHGDKS